MFFGRDVAASNRRILSDYALPQVAPRRLPACIWGS